MATIREILFDERFLQKCLVLEYENLQYSRTYYGIDFKPCLEEIGRHVTEILAWEESKGGSKSSALLIFFYAGRPTVPAIRENQPRKKPAKSLHVHHHHLDSKKF